MDIVVIVIVATLLLIGIISYFMVGKLKKEVWEGELIDKREETITSNDSDSIVYTLYIKTNQGTDKKVHVKKKLFETFTAGDKVIKVKGETYPKKAS